MVRDFNTNGSVLQRIVERGRLLRYRSRMTILPPVMPESSASICGGFQKSGAELHRHTHAREQKHKQQKPKHKEKQFIVSME